MSSKAILVDKGKYKMVQTSNRDVYIFEDKKEIMHIVKGAMVLDEKTFDEYLKLVEFIRSKH